MLYICTKFHENISKGFRVTQLTQFPISIFSKRHRSVENKGGVMILVLNTFSDHALSISKGYRVMEDLISNIQNFQRATIL